MADGKKGTSEGPDRDHLDPRTREALRETFSRTAAAREAAQSQGLWINRHWLALLNGAVALFVLGALLAPALMRAGYTGPAAVLYTLYGFTCHQLPERSYFLFGRQLMYPVEQILDAWPEANTLWQQRAIVGDPVFGYKVALANRCSAIYPSILFAGLLFGLTRRRIKPLSLLAFAIMILPMALDGGTHFISEVTRLGFRDSNLWLQTITGGVFPPDFYAGDAFGSFNWLMRTLTGALFGVALIWLGYPYLKMSFGEIRRPRSKDPAEPEEDSPNSVEHHL